MKKSRFLKTISAIWFCVKQVGSRVFFLLGLIKKKRWYDAWN